MQNSKNTVCVIEDNTSIRKLFVMILTKGGFTVTDFEAGEPALDWIFENQPDIVITDIMLPDVNGTEILTALRTEGFKSMTIIALTAFARQGDQEKYLTMGFNGYISKPIDPQSFVSEVKQIAGIE